jgi:hypothetical protein
MPVTAKLSKQFYDRFGEAITNELVDWMNQVDASYKSDIREMNELNYARFEAKLDQRLAEMRADFTALRGEVQADSTKLRGDLRVELAEFRGEMRAGLSALETKLGTKLESGLRDQTRFLVGAWGVLLAAIIALSFRR